MLIVVAGDQETAVQIAESARNHQVSLITRETTTSVLDQLEVSVVRGSITSASALRQAGSALADFFVAASLSDESNIVACLSAARLGARRTICFLGSALGAHFEYEDDVTLAESIVGVDEIIRPHEQLAEEIIRIIAVPGALDVRSFQGGRVRLLKCSVPPDARIVGVPLKDISVPVGSRLAMVRRHDELFIPTGATVIEAGDQVTSLGTRRALRLLHRQLLGRSTRRGPRQPLAFVCGGGAVGSRIARGLTDRGFAVKVVESDPQRFEELEQELPCTVIHGDGSDLEMLETEDLASADALVAVTNNDESNLLISLLAKSVGVPRIITRADRAKNGLLFEKVGIDVVLSARGAAIRTVVGEMALARAEARPLADLEHGDITVFELLLTADFPATPLSQLEPPRLANVGAILRDRTTIIPMGSDELRPGDKLLLIGRTPDIEKIRHYFADFKPRVQETA